jgi:signal transduction histidine kinase
MSARLAGIERMLTGLRPRLLAAMLLVSAVTLGVAALALLSPLEQRLREDGVREVQYAMLSARSRFTHLKIEPSNKLPDRRELRRVEDQLSHRTGGGEVALLNKEMEVVHPPRYRDLNVPDYYLGASGAARRALLSKGFVRKTIEETAIVALRLKIHGHRYVLVVDKHLEYAAQAAGVVRKAFLVAAAAGLLTALLLGIGIATTMLRRLERLRDATAGLERRGLDAPVPKDSGRDEIGDLSRAFAGMQSQLRRQEDARRSFVATASHELRTPLASLDGMLELLEEDLDDEALDLQDARLRTEHAREQTRRLSQLATDLLDLSRLDTEVQLRREPLELGEMARAVAAEFELSAAKRDVTLDATPPQEPCWTSADPGSVARIVRILIDNALRFAPPSSSIEISAGRNQDFAQVLVRDHGPGVPPGERERIFERFTRGRDAARRGGGFGLGLAIGRELALRMGGDLELLRGHDDPAGQRTSTSNGMLSASQHGGKGACFALRLPAIPAELEVAVA